MAYLSVSSLWVYIFHKHTEIFFFKLYDIFAYLYKQDKFRQKHIQNLTWLSI